MSELPIHRILITGTAGKIGVRCARDCAASIP
jgi:hypothetical protein